MCCIVQWLLISDFSANMGLGTDNPISRTDRTDSTDSTDAQIYINTELFVSVVD